MILQTLTILILIITCFKQCRGELREMDEASRSKRQYITNAIPQSTSSCNCLSKYTPVNCKCTGMPSISDELLCRCDRASLAREEENKQQCPCRNKGAGNGWGESEGGYFPVYRGEERSSDLYPRALSPSVIHSACHPICHQSCLSTCTRPYTREIDPYRERERYSSGYANDQDPQSENSLLAADYSPTGCQVSHCRTNCLKALPYQETEPPTPSHYEVRPVDRPIYVTKLPPLQTDYGASALSSCQCSPDAICECPE
uniref:Uncharacterized protein n=1 Tax=Meloidogyne javanica TaxID=6303 RepID=A0A915MQ02_MELJA